MMLRGRHRGLPVAIDRAILLPFEFGAGGKKDDEFFGADRTHGDDIIDDEDTNANTNANAATHHGGVDNSGIHDGGGKTKNVGMNGSARELDEARAASLGNYIPEEDPIR